MKARMPVGEMRAMLRGEWQWRMANGEWWVSNGRFRMADFEMRIAEQGQADPTGQSRIRHPPGLSLPAHVRACREVGAMLRADCEVSAAARSADLRRQPRTTTSSAHVFHDPGGSAA
jgi:hypothetical protein